MRLIDADLLKSDMHEAIFDGDGTYKIFGVSIRQLDSVPTVDPVKHGRIIWKKRRTGGYEYKDVRCHRCGATESVKIRSPIDEEVPYCSECGKRLCSNSLEYCPTCGAKMDANEQPLMYGVSDSETIAHLLSKFEFHPNTEEIIQ